MRSARKRSVRPEVFGLEGRQLLSAAAGHVAVPKKAPVDIAAFHAGVSPNTTATPVSRSSFRWSASVFGVRSNSAPAITEFRGKAIIAWSDASTGILSVARVVGRNPNCSLTNTEVLLGDVSPGRSPALATLNGCLYMAWTEPSGKMDVTCSTDGMHFANKETLAGASSSSSPTLSAFNGRLYVGFTGTNHTVNVESLANGRTFGNKVTLAASSFYSPALAAFNGRLCVAWTGTNAEVSFLSSADGKAFGNEVILTDYTTAVAPALTVVNPGPKRQPARLVAGFTNVSDSEIWLVDVTNRMTNPNAPVPYQYFNDGPNRHFAVNGVTLASPSAGTLDMAWTSAQANPHQLEFLPVPKGLN
jgi:hypothetical protein